MNHRHSTSSLGVALLATISALLAGCDTPLKSSPCAVDNGGCGAHAVCSANLDVNVTTATCACESGYTGDGHTCTQVSCNNCDAHASCQSWSGGEHCVCNAGFTGDGSSCTTDNPCLVDNGGCGTVAAAACTLVDGAASCTCNSGYDKQNGVCTDVDECASAPCDFNATCTNTPGSFTCECNLGYSGNGLQCVTTSFCEQQVGVCGVGECHNVPGGHYCTCPFGYAGTNGATCIDIDECLSASNPCGAGGTCENRPGTFTCTSCPDGKVYDQVTCVEDLCEQDNGGCDVNATCTMARGAAVCACKQMPDVHYYGDGITCSIGFASVSAGIPLASDASTTCGIRRDNTVWCWGANARGQFGNDTATDSNVPVHGFDGAWKQVSVGAGFACGIGLDRSLWCWGSNDRLQLGTAASGANLKVQLEATSLWTSIVTGSNFALAIRSDGQLWGWGDNAAGQIGQTGGGTKTIQLISAEQWTTIAAGTNHACGIRNNGALFCWGDNTKGQIGLPPNASQPVVQVGTDSDWQSVSLGAKTTCALKSNHTMWCWGDNSSRVLGLANNGTDVSEPTQVGTDTDWDTISLGSASACATKEDKTLWCWGMNNSGQLGSGSTVRQDTPTAVPGGILWRSVSVGGGYTCGVSTEDAVRCWGSNTVGQLGIGKDAKDKLSPVRTGTTPRWSRIVHGGAHTCALGLDGSLSCWGRNDQGQLGDGTQIDHSSPIRIGTDADWTDLMAGSTFTCGLRQNSSLWCWGSLGSLDKVASPTQVGESVSWRALTTSSSLATHACAIASTGNLWCWGLGAGGVLGTGTAANQNGPVTLNVEMGWSSAARGGTFTCAIKQDDNSLWCWGTNSWRRSVSTPAVFDATAWKSVSAGTTHACGLHLADNSLWCWGDNSLGEVGNGTTTGQVTPALIGGTGVRWSSVSTGPTHTCATKESDGSLWCWGVNANGQLGLGVTATSTTPVHVGSMKWGDVAAGSGRTCGLNGDDGILWCWGVDNFGQTGDASSFAPTPAQAF